MFLEVTKKDIKAELRSKSTLSLMMLFSLTAAFLFSAAMLKGEELFAPLLLLISIFAGVLGYSISFLKEFDSETIEGLRASPLTAQQIVAGKTLFNLFLMLIVQSVLFPVCYALFDVSGDFVLSFAVFTVCNSALAITITALAPLASKSRARELLIPVMLFPVVFPIISSTIVALTAALNGTLEIATLTFVTAYAGMIVSISMLTADVMLSR